MRIPTVWARRRIIGHITHPTCRWPKVARALIPYPALRTLTTHPRTLVAAQTRPSKRGRRASSSCYSPSPMPLAASCQSSSWPTGTETLGRCRWPKVARALMRYPVLRTLTSPSHARRGAAPTVDARQKSINELLLKAGLGSILPIVILIFWYRDDWSRQVRSFSSSTTTLFHHTTHPPPRHCVLSTARRPTSRCGCSFSAGSAWAWSSGSSSCRSGSGGST